MNSNRCHLLHTSISSLVAVGIGLVVVGPSFAKPTSAGDAALFQRLDADRDGVLSADEVQRDMRRLFDRLLRRGDDNGDGALSSDEFAAALALDRPEKPIEEKQPANFPQADAVRYLLLALDTNGNRVIDAKEVPDRLQPVFESMVERIDRNNNGRLEPAELSRSGPQLAQIAGRYVSRERINVTAELAKLEKSQSKSSELFDNPQPPVEMLSDPQQARELFARLDANGDGQLETSEAPEQVQPQIMRFMRLADRDRDGTLSEREFLAAAERFSRFMSRRQNEPAAGDDAMPQRKSARNAGGKNKAKSKSP